MIKTKSWFKVTHGFIPRKIQWHIHTDWWSLVNWVAPNTYETLYKRHMNINEMASQPWGWHQPLWWSMYQQDTQTPTYLPLRKQTDVCENITFPKLRFRAVITHSKCCRLLIFAKCHNVCISASERRERRQPSELGGERHEFDAAAGGE